MYRSDLCDEKMPLEEGEISGLAEEERDMEMEDFAVARDLSSSTSSSSSSSDSSSSSNSTSSSDDSHSGASSSRHKKNRKKKKTKKQSTAPPNASSGRKNTITTTTKTTTKTSLRNTTDVTEQVTKNSGRGILLVATTTTTANPTTAKEMQDATVTDDKQFPVIPDPLDHSAPHIIGDVVPPDTLDGPATTTLTSAGYSSRTSHYRFKPHANAQSTKHASTINPVNSTKLIPSQVFSTATKNTSCVKMESTSTRHGRCHVHQSRNSRVTRKSTSNLSSFDRSASSVSRDSDFSIYNKFVRNVNERNASFWHNMTKYVNPRLSEHEEDEDVSTQHISAPIEDIVAVLLLVRLSTEDAENHRGIDLEAVGNMLSPVITTRRSTVFNLPSSSSCWYKSKTPAPSAMRSKYVSTLCRLHMGVVSRQIKVPWSENKTNPTFFPKASSCNGLQTLLKDKSFLVPGIETTARSCPSTVDRKERPKTLQLMSEDDSYHTRGELAKIDAFVSALFEKNTTRMTNILMRLHGITRFVPHNRISLNFQPFAVPCYWSQPYLSENKDGSLATLKTMAIVAQSLLKIVSKKEGLRVIEEAFCNDTINECYRKLMVSANEVGRLLRRSNRGLHEEFHAQECHVEMKEFITLEKPVLLFDTETFTESLFSALTLVPFFKSVCIATDNMFLSTDTPFQKRGAPTVSVIPRAASLKGTLVQCDLLLLVLGYDYTASSAFDLARLVSKKMECPVVLVCAKSTFYADSAPADSVVWRNLSDISTVALAPLFAVMCPTDENTLTCRSKAYSSYNNLKSSTSFSSGFINSRDVIIEETAAADNFMSRILSNSFSSQISTGSRGRLPKNHGAPAQCLRDISRNLSTMSHTVIFQQRLKDAKNHELVSWFARNIRGYIGHSIEIPEPRRPPPILRRVSSLNGDEGSLMGRRFRSRSTSILDNDDEVEANSSYTTTFNGDSSFLRYDKHFVRGSRIRTPSPSVRYRRQEYDDHQFRNATVVSSWDKVYQSNRNANTEESSLSSVSRNRKRTRSSLPIYDDVHSQDSRSSFYDVRALPTRTRQPSIFDDTEEEEEQATTYVPVNRRGRSVSVSLNDSEDNEVLEEPTPRRERKRRVIIEPIETGHREWHNSRKRRYNVHGDFTTGQRITYNQPERDWSDTVHF